VFNAAAGRFDIIPFFVMFFGMQPFPLRSKQEAGLRMLALPMVPRKDGWEAAIKQAYRNGYWQRELEFLAQEADAKGSKTAAEAAKKPHVKVPKKQAAKKAMKAAKKAVQAKKAKKK